MNDHDDVRDALASHADDYAVHRELHRVPPHVTHEVTVDGRRAVCKRATHPAGDPATEARAIEFVREHTSLPVPRILAVGSDHFVAEWLDGVPTDPTIDERRVRAMGRGLATLHAKTSDYVASSGLLTVRDGALAVRDPGPWSGTLRALLAECRAFLADRGYADVAEAVLEFVREHSDLFDAADDPVLCHGNWLADHVGVDRSAGDGPGEVTAVIDFEHALVGPAEWDYLRSAVPTVSGDTPVAESTFRDPYASVRPLPDGADERRTAHEAVLGVTYLVALFLQRGRPEGGPGTSERREPSDPPDAVARRADRTMDLVRDRLATLRSDFA